MIAQFAVGVVIGIVLGFLAGSVRAFAIALALGIAAVVGVVLYQSGVPGAVAWFQGITDEILAFSVFAVGAGLGTVFGVAAAARR